jgi:hypothetical protein
MLLCLGAVVGQATAADAQPPDSDLWSRLHTIEGAFRGGDAQSLRSAFPASGKVRVDLRELTEGPSAYAAGQLQVIFGRIFERHPTRDFAFGRDEVTTSASGMAFARGRWVRRGPQPGRDVIDTLTFTLREERGDWRILEIRSSR